MTFTDEVERALAWLGEQNKKGGVYRNVNLATGKRGTISLEITGYLVHLYAWLHRVTAQARFLEATDSHVDWLREQMESLSPYEYTPFEPRSKFSYFFDCGMAGRGLLALSNVQTGSAAAENRRLAMLLSLEMQNFRRPTGQYEPIIQFRKGTPALANERWSSVPGPWQLKAALLWRTLGDTDSWERLLRLWHEWRAPVASGEPDISDLTHPFAYYFEALAMSGQPIRLGVLADRLDQSRVRCDTLAQYMRLGFFLCIHDGPAIAALSKRLLSYQHESGGFHFVRDQGELGPHLSVHATIFAVQALVMGSGFGNIDIEVFRAGASELAIV